MRFKFPSAAWWFCLPILLGLTWCIYYPGLRGTFLFDDFANMPALGSTGPVTHWATFFRYITSGTADPTGRPLTLLTFLLDGHDWPTAAYPFKRTNVLLHLINGALLALVMARLATSFFVVANKRERTRVILSSITAATMWMIHPLFVSTVLYVVQREAMLPMTCVLIGLLLWLHGRNQMVQGRTVAGFVWIAAGLFGFTGFAVLSKANGILLPMYAVLIEYLLLRRSPQASGLSALAGPLHGKDVTRTETTAPDCPPAYRRTLLLFGWLPSIAVLGYLINIGIQGALHGIGRPWSMGQRLLTEPRVLFDYLELLWMPRPFTPGLFNDQIVASSSLLSPISTAIALLGLLALLTAAWLLRRRRPILAFAILFFFTAHLLESSTVALELYFEHRNYIPAMFMFWPLSLWLWGVGRHSDEWIRLKIALIVILIAGLATMTYARTDLWGNGQQQALLWAKLNPASARAQANAANHEMAMGQPRAAEIRLAAILRDHPSDPQITLNILSAHCQLGGMTEDDLRLAERTLEHLRNGESVIFHWLGNAIALSATHSCPGLTSQAVASMLDAAERNTRLRRVTGRVQDIYHLRGQLALSLQQPDEALMWYQKALALRPGPQMAFEQAAQLGSAGYPALGLRHLDSFESYSWTKPATIFGMPRLHAWVLHKQHYWDTELVYLRVTLQGDLKHSDAKNSRTLP
ncbi:MAG TPA: tetratricopeptide repeat protein [Devosia sp.]|nr:tetratricopeptide repeat protein [Devosia sp.]